MKKILCFTFVFLCGCAAIVRKDVPMPENFEHVAFYSMYDDKAALFLVRFCVDENYCAYHELLVDVEDIPNIEVLRNSQRIVLRNCKVVAKNNMVNCNINY